MRDLRKCWFIILLLVFIALRASTAFAAPTLVHTIDLGTWTGSPANIPLVPLRATFTASPVFLPMPQPPPGHQVFSPGSPAIR